MKKILKYLIILGLLQANAEASSEPPKTNLEDGLVGWYPFDGNASDISGNANDGITFGVTLTNDRFGEQNKAFSFDGKDDYIELPPRLSKSLTRDLSLSVWVKSYAQGPDFIFLRHGKSWSETIKLGLNEKGNHSIDFRINNHKQISTNKLSQGKWHNIVVSYNGGTQITYLDNKKISSQTKSGNLLESLGSSYIGVDRDRHGFNQFYSGVLDDFRIYNKALSFFEVKELYKLESKPTKPAPDATPPKTGPGDAPDLKCKETIAKLEQEIKDQKIEITDLNILVIELRKQVADLNSSNLALTTEVSGLKNQVNNLNGQVASLSTENGELKGQVTNLREDNGNLQVNVTSLKEQLVEADRIAKTPFVHDWVYTPDHGWLHIDPQNFPIIYKNDTQTWHFYEQGSINPRYFYNFKEQKWEAWDSIPSGNEN